VEDKTPVYNIIGYAYVQLEQFDKGLVFLDSAIELSPDQPNPYDAKGDYFMAIQDYENAYLHYLKALEIDSLFPSAKYHAKYVKMILDSIPKIKGNDSY
jgi:tetratricopeptide (TPR) repeat protein